MNLPGFNLEALAYCILWAVLAVVGYAVGGLKVGLLLSVGLFLLIMPLSALVLTRTGSFKAERTVRWGLLAAAALMLASYADLNG
ncbi:MAG TPA: hypothetical protein VEY69_14760 [Lautropia sp.]|nr:hypothetical protein [Lautropia sp.]